MMIAMILGSVVSGLTNAKIGYYTPLAIVGSCIMPLAYRGVILVAYN